MKESRLWWLGPEWLTDRDRWPSDIKTTATVETRAEVKIVQEIFVVAVERPADEFDTLLSKFVWWKTMRVGAWIYRFMNNTNRPKNRRSLGALTSEEMDKESAEGKSQFEEDRLQLSLQKNSTGIPKVHVQIPLESTFFS